MLPSDKTLGCMSLLSHAISSQNKEMNADVESEIIFIWEMAANYGRQIFKCCSERVLLSKQRKIFISSEAITAANSPNSKSSSRPIRRKWIIRAQGTLPRTMCTFVGFWPFVVLLCWKLTIWSDFQKKVSIRSRVCRMILVRNALESSDSGASDSG